MKTTVGKVARVAAWVSILSTAALHAQHVGSPFTATPRNPTGNLTLLTGPDVLSLARGLSEAPSPMLSPIVPVDADLTFRASTTGEARQPARTKATPSSRTPQPEQLRFENTLPPTPVTLPTQTAPTAK